MIPNDPYNAFCRQNHVERDGAPDGPLRGLTFAVKDVFDIAGHRTGNGNPLWLETHPPATRTASAVERLLAAGAKMVGKTYTDELAYSLNGENVHYGTPINPRAPGRIPGGSSSGSAVAVAGGLVDFALGSDCGGSVRLPASYCGIYGIRTTHGLVPADGVVDLAKSFDTVGWFARDAAMMLRVGEVLLPSARDFVPKRLLIAEDAFAFVGAEIAAALATAVAKLKAVLPDHRASRSIPASLLLGRAFSASCRATKSARGTAPGSTHIIRASAPALPSASPGRAPSSRPKSSACGRSAKQSPRTWMRSLAMTRCCACRQRRALRRNWPRPRPSSKSSARAPSDCCRLPGLRACRSFHCRLAHCTTARWVFRSLRRAAATWGFSLSSPRISSPRISSPRISSPRIGLNAKTAAPLSNLPSLISTNCHAKLPVCRLVKGRVRRRQLCLRHQPVRPG